MMEEKQYEYKGLAYRMEESDGEFRFHIPSKKFASAWFNKKNSVDTPEQAAHKSARYLIEVYSLERIIT